MNRRGFTLIEVLVALVILLIGLLAVIQLSLAYINANTFNHMMSEATILAQEKMEELRSYARSDRADRYSALDFDYLTSTETDFTSFAEKDLSGTVKEPLLIVDGLLSGGNGGTNKVAPWNPAYGETDAKPDYFVLYDDGAHEDGGSGDGVYGTTWDEEVLGPAGTTAFTVTTAWTIEPLAADYAELTVTSKFTDRTGTERSVTFVSLVNRRQ
ncbi:MAG: type IV pilus modification protein PilV [Deltaproteobacteria bacterium]|nr:MAG: type IV pilus modification protein PilV [Deltaproteobacteria bacterium]